MIHNESNLHKSIDNNFDSTIGKDQFLLLKRIQDLNYQNLSFFQFMFISGYITEEAFQIQIDDFNEKYRENVTKEALLIDFPMSKPKTQEELGRLTREERIEYIKEFVQQNKKATVKELMNLFKKSHDTIRNDIYYISQQFKNQFFVKKVKTKRNTTNCIYCRK